MQPLLARRLIEKQALLTGTRVLAGYYGHGLAGAGTAWVTALFVVRRAYVSPAGEAVILGVSGEEGAPARPPVRLGATDVVRLDGMAPDRFARLFQLNEAGEELPPVRRRGRRRKAERGLVAPATPAPRPARDLVRWHPAGMVEATRLGCATAP